MNPIPIRLGVAGLVALGVVAMLGFSGAGPHVAVIASLVVVGAMIIWLIRDVIEVAIPTGESVRRVRADPEPRADRRVTRLRSGLAYGRPDGASLDTLRTRLIELIDDQLLWAHQINRHDDPDAARVILAPRLRAFVDDPDSARDLTRPAELDRILTLIERL